MPAHPSTPVPTATTTATASARNWTAPPPAIPALPHTVHRPTSVEEAATLLADLGPDGEPLAGGTWIMRTPLRGELFRPAYVALRHIPELHTITIADDDTTLGALLTHTRIAALDGGPALTVLTEAARTSAFPQVRNVATLGGNIGATATAFAEADLVPALLAADTRLLLHGAGGAASTPHLTDYLATRTDRPVGEVITGVVVPTPPRRRSTFERLTVRAAGEYPIVNVAVSIDVADQDDTVLAARIAVGSVEPVARLCRTAAAALVGHPVGDQAAIDRAGAAAVAECTARDGDDAPGWYRLDVLPALLRRAVGRITRK